MKKITSLLFLIFTICCGIQKLNAQCVTTYPYSEGFESSAAWTTGVVSGTNNWAWGTPSHPSINAAAGGTKCWCVGGLTGSNYLSSDQCWIMSPCFDFTTLNNPWISFDIYWECERQWDGMTFQSSIDGGVTWQNVGTASDPVNCLNQNWFNHSSITYLTSIASKQGWSGRTGPTSGTCVGGFGSNGWVTAKHCMSSLANQPNVRFRFLFGSGTTCNSYDGIAVDDILIDNSPPNVANFSYTCAGINAVNFTNLSTPCPTSYSWNFGDPASGAANTSASTNPSHTFSGPGTYTVSLISSGPCNANGNFSMPITILNSTITSTSILCNGDANGSSTVTVAGSAGPFTYSWSPSGGTGATANSLAPGNYSVTVTAPGACPVTATVSITQPPVLSTSSSQTNVNCNGNTANASVVASGGTGPYTYSWSPSGGTGSTASGLGAGPYTCTVTDAHGCITTQSFSITQPSAITSTPSQGTISCSGGTTTASVAVSGGTPGYSYTWTPSGGNGATSTALGVGSYTCTITDANGCVFPQSFIITQPSTLSTTASQGIIACNGGTTSAVVTASGGTSSYTYAWIPSGGTSSVSTPLGAGSYTCTVTDANGCTILQPVTITQPTLLTATSLQGAIACNGGTTTEAVFPSGGTGPYSYSWTPTGGTNATATGMGAGNYTCTITDAHGCVTTQSFINNAPAVLTSTQSQTNVTCNGGANGTATIVASGGTPAYTYSWAPVGGNTATASGLGAGTFTCTITDANGCAITQNYTITQPTPVLAPTSSTTANCGGTNGTATVTASGGIGPYTYSWAPSGGTAATASGLIPGSYTVTVTSAGGCTVTAVAVVGSTSGITASTSAITNVSCFGGSNGSATAAPIGGTAPFIYAWSSSASSTATASGLTAGSYTCTVTDANGCIATTSITITQPAVLSVTHSQVNILCNAGNNGSASIVTSGGTGPYTYSWTPYGGTSANANNLSSGTFTCTITDANGCNTTQSFSITQPTAISLSTSGNTISCFGGTNGTAAVTANGGTPNYSYNWLPSGGTNATATNLASGTYSVIVSDANACADTATVTLTQPATSVSVTTSSTPGNCGGNGTATANPSGGTGPYSFSWSPNGSGSTISATAGTYTVTVTDVNGCIVTQSVTITQSNNLVATVSSTNTSCYNFSNGTATATPTSGTAPYTYSWSPSGGTNQTATGLPVGSYTCVVTDANGCTSTQSIIVTQPSAIVVNASADSVCPGSSAQVTANTSGGTVPYTYLWSNGNTNSSQNIIVTQNTSYSVTVTDANGCSASSTTLVNVLTPPQAAFTANTTNGVFQLNETSDDLCFTNTSVNASTWIWSLNGQASITQSPCVTLTSADTGTYCATLVVQNASGCIDSTTTCFEIINSHYSIPNIFTPNGDGTNDIFIITNDGIAKLHCEVYDRWGILVYEWDSVTGGWDGHNMGGALCTDGVYYYDAQLTDFSGKETKEKGFVHLVSGSK